MGRGFNVEASVATVVFACTAFGPHPSPSLRQGRHSRYTSLIVVVPSKLSRMVFIFIAEISCLSSTTRMLGLPESWMSGPAAAGASQQWGRIGHNEEERTRSQERRLDEMSVVALSIYRLTVLVHTRSDGLEVLWYVWWCRQGRPTKRTIANTKPPPS
jgi:hypothetical protein